MNCLVAQSGGPTTAINASLSGVISAALKDQNITNIYGALNGVQGILNENIIELHKTFTNDKSLEQLKHTPAMFLGSCRFKLDKEITSPQYEKIFDTFAKYDIKYFFYIGGNDSMDTVDKLSQFAKEQGVDIKVIGIPKTVDNDLFGTDHTPGFGSAAKYVATSILNIAHDAYIYDMKSVTIVEIMGRNAGWLTAASALARNEYNVSPDLIYLPEVPFDTYHFLNDVKNLISKKNNVIIAVSEGIKDLNGNYVSATATNQPTDGFGHALLSGTGKALEGIVKTALNCKVRSIEFSVLQRSAMHIASKTDLDEAFSLGNKAVEYARENLTGIMLTLNRKSNDPYTIDIDYIPISEVANKEKQIPRHWINEAGNDINDELLAYMKPLIIGESPIKFENGLPHYMNINHLLDKA